MNDSDLQVLWAGIVYVDYGFYQVGAPQPHHDLGQARTAMLADASGVYAFTLGGGGVFDVLLEVVLDQTAPEAGAEVVTGSSSSPGLGVTNWDATPTEPPAENVVGPGTWQLWLERIPAVVPLDKDEAYPAELHILHAYPADETARAWAATATLQPRAPEAIRSWAEATAAQAASSLVVDVPDYTEFVEATPGIYFVIWDQKALQAELDRIDLDVALPDDNEPLELPGGIVFRHRALARINVTVMPAPLPQPTEVQVEKRRLKIPQAANILVTDSSFRPPPQLPTPFLRSPCEVRLCKGSPDFGVWFNSPQPRDETTAALWGMYDWWVEFAL